MVHVWVRVLCKKLLGSRVAKNIDIDVKMNPIPYIFLSLDISFRGLKITSILFMTFFVGFSMAGYIQERIINSNLLSVKRKMKHSHTSCFLFMVKS